MEEDSNPKQPNVSDLLKQNIVEDNKSGNQMGQELPNPNAPKNSTLPPIQTSQPNQQKPEGFSANNNFGKKLNYADILSSAPRGNAAISPIRTYENDVVNVIKNDNVSMVKIAMAEKVRQEKQGEREEEISKGFKMNIYIVAISIILVVGGLVTGIYVYYKSLPTPATAINPDNLPHFFYTEKEKNISIDDLDPISLSNVIMKEKSLDIPEGSIEEIRFIQQIGTTTSYASSADILGALKARIDPAFARALDQDFIYGIYSYKPNGNFFLFKLNSYENAYAGMLSWEKTMDVDIGGLFYQKSNTISQISTSTSATSTIKTFQDKEIQNFDTRAYSDQNGNIYFFYTFIDRNTLIITSDEATLKEILSRSTSSHISR